MQNEIVDHLFRHQYGKMVAILTRFFGLSHIETIEDAVQDTFIKATLQWRSQIPENPEAWLTKAAKNRTIDLLRKVKAEQNRLDKLVSGPATHQLNEMFLDHEIEDNQLRMIFVACHPILHPKEQIAFALKTISGFSTKEIASALLTKDESIKKRLSRARKLIAIKKIEFEFPEASELDNRLSRVMEVLYLTFNEGFHSGNKNQLIRTDLCAEAMRLCQLLLKKEQFRSGALYALYALMCFHAARLDSKTNAKNEIIDIQHQDRSKWHWPLINLGNSLMNKAMNYKGMSVYHYQAAIAAEHLKAPHFRHTNWTKILHWYSLLNAMQPSPFGDLNKALVFVQLNEIDLALQLLNTITPQDLEQRAYLLNGAYASLYEKSGDKNMAISYLEKAINSVKNDLEKSYLVQKKENLLAT